MTMLIVSNFTLYNDDDQSVLDSELPSWMIRAGGFEIFGPVIAYSWNVGGRFVRLDDQESQLSVHLLPDSTGFICFEKGFKADNCLLLDAYGKERIRLTVPWELTGYAGVPPEMRKHGKPRPRTMWFRSTSAPYTNLETGEPGKFGVTANLTYGDGPCEYCDYYFELDWHTGRFLWGRPIRY